LRNPPPPVNFSEWDGMVSVICLKWCAYVLRLMYSLKFECVVTTWSFDAHLKCSHAASKTSHILLQIYMYPNRFVYYSIERTKPSVPYCWPNPQSKC
jgi:hypothetical protein